MRVRFEGKVDLKIILSEIDSAWPKTPPYLRGFPPEKSDKARKNKITLFVLSLFDNYVVEGQRGASGGFKAGVLVVEKVEKIENFRSSPKVTKRLEMVQNVYIS